jgi:rRNA small subunit pseudouridine methyltransferase Nep1
LKVFHSRPPSGPVALRILLAEAELELVPPEIAGHPAIRKQSQAMAKKAGQILLDQNAHKQAMGSLADAPRRGRPDIVHYCLLTLLESPLGKAGHLEVAIHTRHGELIRVRPETRLPRGESRFHGVMSRVLRDGASHDKDPLLWVEGRYPPQGALERFATGPVLRLDESGSAATPLQVVDQAQSGELTLVLGAYPQGDWSEAWKKAVPKAVSIWPEPLNAWAVAAEVVAAWRARHGPGRPVP